MTERDSVIIDKALNFYKIIYKYKQFHSESGNVPKTLTEIFQLDPPNLSEEELRDFS